MDLFSTKAAIKAAAAKAATAKAATAKTGATKSIISNKISTTNVVNKPITTNSVNKLSASAGSHCGITVGSNGVGGNCTVHPGGNPNLTVKPEAYYRGHGDHGWNIKVRYDF